MGMRPDRVYAWLVVVLGLILLGIAWGLGGATAVNFVRMDWLGMAAVAGAGGWLLVDARRDRG